MLFFLVFTTFLLFSGCGSKQLDNQQVVMSNIASDNLTPSPSAIPSPSPTLTGSPAPATTQPVQTPTSTSSPTVTPEQIKPLSTKEVPVITPAPQNEPLVFIDAGHGGNDPGTSDNGLVEKEVTLDIAKRLDQVLTNNKIKTYMVRTGDKFIDHRDRIYLANDMKASLYISIHCDWFDNPKYGGTQTFYTTAKDLRLGGLTELQYAKFVHNELINTIKSNNRGISDRPTLAAVKYATMPSILIETGFLSNPGDATNLATGEYRQKIADSMASGISQSLKMANPR